MSDHLVSLVRTFVPIGVGSVLAWLASLGVELDAQTQAGVIVTLTGLAIALYYALARWLEQRWPLAGRWLLGTVRTPVYAQPDAVVRVDGVLRRDVDGSDNPPDWQ